MTDSFSRRYGFAGKAAEITIRQDAPADLRFALLQTAVDLGFGPKALRTVVCRVLLQPPDPGNWSEYPNVWDEVQRLVRDCLWFRVYDIIEELSKVMGPRSQDYAREMNVIFVERGIGWQLENNRIVTRGEEAFEAAVRAAAPELAAAGRATAKGEITEALLDLSRRPDPDITGAIQHGIAALECVARDATGMPKATLGDILKARPALIPAPLDGALEKLWGYSSQYGRHILEGRPPSYEEAELAVGIAASTATYLSRKYR